MKSFLTLVLKFLGFLAIFLLLVFAISKLIPNPTSTSTSKLDLAYPPPSTSPTPTSTRTNTPLPYPPPGKTGFNTETPIYAPTKAKPVLPTPPGWPTGIPWPPPKTTPQPMASSTPIVFPTPVFLSTPSGKMPIDVQKLLFLSLTDSNSTPLIQTYQIDNSAQLWGKESIEIDLGLKAYFPGPLLLGLYPSPSGILAVAVTGYGEAIQPYLISLLTGKANRILPDKPTLRFLGWSPDSQKLLIQLEPFDLSAIWELSIITNELTAFKLPRMESGNSHIQAIAYSKDGNILADAWVFPPTQSIRESCVLSIGIRKNNDVDRKVIKEIPNSCGITEFSLRWSANGRFLSWVALTTLGNGDLKSKQQAEVWIYDYVSGETKMNSILSDGVGQISPPSWSPDSTTLAIIKYEDLNIRYSSGNIFLIDPISGLEKQITHLTKKFLSNLSWSPNGKWITYTDSDTIFGSIWAVNSDGNESFPIAGPVPTYSPYIWLK